MTEYLEVPTKGMAAYRAPSMTQPHKARQALRDAYEGKIKPLIGYYCGVSSVPTGRIMALMGADIVWIDWEHSSCNVETMTAIAHDIQFMSEGRTMPFVRVPGHDHASIGYALDAGASIIVPQVETVEQARHIVSAAKFGAARKGTRSAPPCRWLPGVSDMAVDPTRSLWENQNDQAAIVIQIENEEGARNLDAILAAVGDQIDAVWLGSLDMRISMGLDSFWGSEPRFLEIVDSYRETLKKHDVPESGMCLFGNWPSGANKAFVVVGGDAFALLGDMALINGARENLSPLSANGKGDAKKETGVANGD
ncbi:MAG: hypothetical protein LQ341_005871 [Variospora aurantia]|nr:MAG: hypothetical protein LQ341_005871 [Variospora aurantia]